MKLRLMTLLGAGAALSLAAADSPPPFKDAKEKASYSIGVSIGKNFKAQSADLNLETVLQGMKDAVEGKKTLMTDQEIQETMMSFSAQMRGEPATFPVTGVIKGWTEALQLMPVGSKWQLFIPSDLAYGPNGRPSIPPSSTLLFDLELISIKEPVKDASNAATPKLAK